METAAPEPSGCGLYQRERSIAGNRHRLAQFARRENLRVASVNAELLGLAVAGGTGLLTFAGFWMKFSRDIARAEAKADAAHTLASASNTLAAAAIAKIEIQVADFSQYKVEAAEKYLVSDDIIQAENRTTRAVEELRGDVRGMNERLDRMLERIVEKMSS